MNAARITLDPADAAPPVKPWYREPWPWILMAGPFAAMVGCFITIYLAMAQFADQPIGEGVVKRGLVIEQVAASAAEGRAAPNASPAAAKP
ncbi:FixH family protein [Achromobacter sp. NFACC18-2]|uniref:FixH family protein n=1 Tax=Achromobacter sp. NFACC18-2 TaxID=1564112 RepID=UPI0008ADEFE0|nr:FixH family protein [Achromobacter sp. NFACC18-2]SEJ88441.1 hypothetical protein SAMN03159494_03683 [Achromobacter sp. NFACC18-2]